MSSFSPTAFDSRISLIRPPSRSRPSSLSRSLRSVTSYGTMGAPEPPPPHQQEMVSVPSRTASPVRQPVSSPTSFAPSPSPFSTARPLSPTPSAARRRNGKQPATEDGTSGAAETGKEEKKRRFRFPRLAFELENKGSVARDHLANERTFLAWLRTTLGLASIGIGVFSSLFPLILLTDSSIRAAITQLFRLPSNTTSTTTPPSNSTLPSENLTALLSSQPDLAPLVAYFQAQEARLAAAEKTVQDSTRYKHLGRPIGGTFLLLSLVFLLLGAFLLLSPFPSVVQADDVSRTGIHRYFITQTALMRSPSQFPPSRRSVAFVSFCVGASPLLLCRFLRSRFFRTQVLSSSPPSSRS
jgi:hypothetical protein